MHSNRKQDDPCNARLIMSLYIMLKKENIKIPNYINISCEKQIKNLFKIEKEKHCKAIEKYEERSDYLEDKIDNLEEANIDYGTEIKQKIKIDSLIKELKSISDYELLGITEEEYMLL